MLGIRTRKQEQAESGLLLVLATALGDSCETAQLTKITAFVGFPLGVPLRIGSSSFELIVPLDTNNCFPARYPQNLKDVALLKAV